LATGILVFPDVEVLDFTGPFEVLSVTRLGAERPREGCSPFDVFLVAEEAGPVRATGGLRVVPDHTLEACPRLDLLIVPGGWGTREQIGNTRLLEWIARTTENTRLVASVCTGSFLLAAAGLLRGKRATTHWSSLDRFRAAFPDTTVVDSKHWVEDGTVSTAAGISAGIDLSLRLVARLYGEEVARETARYMEYPYPEGDERRIVV
jgi:transcriptional regulator GlxA family with amidase domain